MVPRYDRNEANELYRKVEQNLEAASKIERDFESFKASTIKIIEVFGKL